MAKKKAKSATPTERENLPVSLATAVLTEAGYRCAVPTCRTILALDLHHMHEVSEGGGDDLSNLIALCPTCHALYHRGTIKRESIQAWKGMLVALSAAFDHEAIDNLLFLERVPQGRLLLSADALLRFARLIAADLVLLKEFKQLGADPRQVEVRSEQSTEASTPAIALRVTFEPRLSQKGRLLIEAWKKGDREAVRQALAPPAPPCPAT